MLWFRKKTSYVITTHQTKTIEFQRSKRNYCSFSFEGIQTSSLKDIISNRVHLVSNFPKEKIEVNMASLEKLILHFDDDFRAILNYLYDSFKKTSK